MRTVAMILALAFVAAPLGGCGKPSDELKKVGTKMGETWDAVKSYSIKKKDDAMVLFRKGMDEVGPTYEAAKKKAAEMGGDASKALDAQWKVVEAKFAEAKDASAENWDSARDAFLKAYEDFKKKIAD